MTYSLIRGLFKTIYDIIVYMLCIVVIVLILSTLISGFEPSVMYAASSLSSPTIVGATEPEAVTINNVLKNTDQEIVHHISRITVQQNKIKCGYRLNEYGCTTTTGKSSLIRIYSVDIPFFYSSINIVSSNYYSNSRYYVCGTFEETLQHEIGHVKGHMYGDDSEEYADNYMKMHTINKGKC